MKKLGRLLFLLQYKHNLENDQSIHKASLVYFTSNYYIITLLQLLVSAY